VKSVSVCEITWTRKACTYGEGQEPKAQPETNVPDEWEDPHLVQELAMRLA